MNTLARKAAGRFSPTSWGRHWVSRWQCCAARHRARRALAELDPRALRDIGLTPSEIDSALAELQGRAPATRRLAMHPLDGRWPA